MKSLVPLLTVSWALAAAAQTDAPIPIETTLSSADQSALSVARRLTRFEELWSKPLAWKETNASTTQVAADVRRQLGPDAPSIEVRAPILNHWTFAMKEAPLGATLCALALLANCQVWVFSDGLVIAPEEALSDDERAAIKARKGGAWEESVANEGSSYKWGGREQIEQVLVNIIGADIQAHLAAKGLPAPVEAPVAPQNPAVPRTNSFDASKPTAPFELPFGELSPVSRQLLQELLKEQVRRLRIPQEQTPTLSPDLVVGFDDKSTSNPRLFVRGLPPTLPPWVAQWFIRQ